MYSNASISSFEILDVDVNFSDHLPLIIKCNINTASVKPIKKEVTDGAPVTKLRWDHADLLSYYSYTSQYLQPIYYELLHIEQNSLLFNDVTMIDTIYERIVNALTLCAAATVPQCKQNFFKFWWCQELDCLKQLSIDTHQLWKAAGQPRSGPLYAQRNKARREYRAAIRNYEMNSVEQYSNDLHDALMKKNGASFWKCWNSKFDIKSNRLQQIDGVIDPQQVANNFAKHFADACSCQSPDGAARLTKVYNEMRANYVGAPHTNDLDFDAELVEKVLATMKRGKAAGLDTLTIEHLQHAHSLLPCVLAKLFNWIMHVGHVPENFGISYTVPLLKGNVSSSKRLSVSDFRGISISPVLSKVFEHCISHRFNALFVTHDNQFGFKKSVGCSQAIYCVNSIVNHYVSNGSTVNLCALDISKAFDRMNHHGLFTKLMRRYVPVTLLRVLEHWFSICSTYVRWQSFFSYKFDLFCGVRQGGILSPYLFAVFIDDVIEHVTAKNIGCTYHLVNVSIFLYADDILLLAPSVHSLQILLEACEAKLKELDLAINVNKSVCTRIGPRCLVNCCPLMLSDGKMLSWVDNIRYLGVFIKRSHIFKCLFENARRSFYRSFNAMFGRIGRNTSEEVILNLIKFKCLPCLLYGVEACPVNRSDLSSFDFVITRVLMKLFRTSSRDIVNECRSFFGFATTITIIRRRKDAFLRKLLESKNGICLSLQLTARRDLLLLQSL